MILDGPPCVSMAQQMLHSNAEQLMQLLKTDHLDYFICEDETLRAEKLGPLQDLIKQYLCQAKHASKFSLPLFGEILQNNIESRPDFDAFETSRAFRALETYSSNLILHPWRLEFRTIKLYSGFYKHNVARHLKGSDQILHLLGYKQREPAVLVLEEPLDPDTLIIVSRNCLIAACECEVMHEIVKRVDQPCSYKELFKLRKSFSCDVDTLVDFFQGQESNKTQRKSDENKSASLSGKVKGDPVQVGKLVDLDSSPEKQKTNLLPGELYENGYTSSLHSGKLCTDPSKNRTINETSSAATLDDHILASVSALQTQEKQQDQSTRAETWGYVDKTLEKKGLHRGYGNRYDVLEDLDRTKPKTSTLPDSDSSAPARKTKTPPQKQPELQVRPVPITEGSAVRYVDPDLIQLDHFNSYLPAHGPPVPGSAPFSRYFRPGIEYQSYGYQQMGGMYNPYDYRPPPSHMYPVPSMPSIAPTMPVQSMDMLDGVQSMHLNSGSAPRNLPTTQPPYITGNPLTENRRSFYDNVPMTVDERPLDPSAMVARGYPPPPNMCFPSNLYTRVPDPMVMYSARDFQRAPPYGNYGMMQVPQMQPDQLPSQRASESAEGMLIDIGTEPSPCEPPTNLAAKGKVDGHTYTPTPALPAQVTTVATVDSSPSPPARARTPSQNGSSKGSSVSNTSNGKRWECPSCTFLNGAGIKICDMCGRSKTKGAESKPLESGGRQCPKCTLVNEREALNCAACETSLKDSPTYI